MLQGEVKVNDYTVAKWKAERTASVGKAYYQYNCTVEYRDMAGYPQKATDFSVVHNVIDGPLLLAAAVLTEAHNIFELRKVRR